jgi:hypothetical protein
MAIPIEYPEINIPPSHNKAVFSPEARKIKLATKTIGCLRCLSPTRYINRKTGKNKKRKSVEESSMGS